LPLTILPHTPAAIGAFHASVCGPLRHYRRAGVNGCTVCLDMHIKLARIHGAGELRVHLAAWRDSILFIPCERAARKANIEN